MKLYLLRPETVLPEDNPWEPWFDKAFGFVVVAPDESTARTWAASKHGEEFRSWEAVEKELTNPWLQSDYTTCVEIAEETNLPAGVVIRDFAAA